ncbi:hypothetical protein BJY52DRAFT_1224475 [Lactarius psammicola]|nr:hypothetical protein BJY52DRAFT_1224475 [Lactarius psammicola]
MSHSPAPPPQLNNTNNNSNSHSNSSPSQLAHILSTVLADNETLSKDLTAARARYERAEQTLALLKPSGASLTAAADASSPPPPPYPEAAVKTILDLQSRLDTEKAAREAADSRLRTISEAWLDLDRYLQASEVHLVDARSHFSQLLRDASIKPSFNPLPAYQPRRPHPPVPRASVAASQTFPSTAPAASLPARVRHRDDSIEDAPPAKRIRRDRGTRHPIEIPGFQSSRLHAHVPPSYSTPEMNHHLHPAYPAQQPHPRGRRLDRHDQSPSLSLSPARSRSSSMSLDELLLEATDNNRASPSSPQPGHAYGMPPSYYRVPSIRPSRSPDYRVPHTHRRETVPQPSATSPAIASPAQAQAQPPPQPQGQYQTLQTHIFAPPVTGPPGKKPKAGVSQRCLPVGFRLRMRKVNASAGNAACLGVTKDGKCVEKWGPGPEGPGTVCDRCRKKMKRVERRGTLDPHSQNTTSFVHPRVHAPVQERNHVHAASASQGSDRTIGRTDTVVVSHPPPPQHLQSYSGPPESREREAGSPRSNASSLTVPRPKVDAVHSVPSSRSRSRSPLPPQLPPQRNGSQAQLPPSKLPPHISSGGESDAEADPEAEADDPEADLLAAVDAAEASSGKAAIAPWIKREVEAV